MSQEQSGVRPAAPSGGYRHWALVILVVVYTSNFIDRTILNILGPSIQKDLHLDNLQLGLLTGTAFAAFYTVLGLGFGWLADRAKRSTVIVASLAIWSAFTAACGYAQNFNQLFLLRMGVGFGEAGCSPAAQSMISDYYSPKSRSTALAIYSTGIPLGVLFGAVVAGWIAQTFGWRQAFMVVGLPGILIALVCRFALKEPPRGRFDAPGAAGERPSPFKTAGRLLRAPSFWHLAFGASLSSMAGYGIAAFAVKFLLAGGFGLDLKTAAFDYGVAGGLAAALGIVLGGVVTDVAGRASVRAYALIPGIGFLIAAPLYVWAFQQTDLIKLATLVIAPLILQYLYLGPTFAVTHNLVEPRMRGMATAILFLPINLIGLGIGPALVGYLADRQSQAHFAGLHAGLFKTLCDPKALAASADTALKGACHVSNFDGVKWAIMVVAGVVYAWAGLHYLLAARSVKRDLERA
ncbi:MAG: MFS transporter [Proteobacteria bacterium]|nr:MFS transporter [Pseudomonadota bacterium]